jgi:hypothetical protein
MLGGLFWYFFIWYSSIIIYRPLRKLEKLRDSFPYPPNQEGQSETATNG